MSKAGMDVNAYRDVMVKLDEAILRKKLGMKEPSQLIVRLMTCAWAFARVGLRLYA